MLDKTYSPANIEQKHYQEWEQLGLFEPDPTSDKPSYAIMMPPPNVTGTLHVGHVLDNGLPDMLVRRARMNGYDALYQPGTDHASIAVHVVLDRKFTEEGTDRFTLGRDEFMKRAWAWKEFSHGTITDQMRRIGISCAWQRERFTMDDGCSKAVEKTFIDLHERGLIYRGQRLVNWDPDMQTAVSDLEVKHKETEGNLWHFNYPLTDGSGHVTVATTRPETMLGDTAVAVNPKDDRYKDIIGKTVMLPLVGREIPVIADDYVDAEFGSGVVKITPAHDFNDFEVGSRHNLEKINIFTPTAHINNNAPEKYRGIERFAARKQVVADMEALELIEKIEKHPHTVPLAERNDTVLEPFLTDQWYVKAGPLAKKCLEAAKEGKIRFLNKRDEKNYYHWLENIQDWCISRQLWWGHRIPAWHHKDGTIKVQSESPGDGWAQDPDILDTWFSSALWPFSTQGWPEETDALAKYYPQAAIMPGPDILFFWIIRMMMMGLEFMGEVPFKDIYTHAMIRDEHGQKMSKSKGNVIDPMDFIEKYGADALRFALVSQCALGQDIKLSEKSVEQARNFCTKLWNAARYALMNEARLDENFSPETAQNQVNKWIIGELAELVAKLDTAYDAYRFNEVGNLLYHFTWDTFCDWYLELTKPLMNGADETVKQETQQTMGWVLDNLLRLMSPVMPFITEELWQNLADVQGKKHLMVQSWPKTENWPQDDATKVEINWLINVISAIRTTGSENKVPPKAEIEARIKGASGQDMQRLETYKPFFHALAKVTTFTPAAQDASQTDAVAVAEGFEIILPLEGIIDFAAEQDRVAREIEKHKSEMQKIEGLLNNPSFVERAPDHVVEANKTKLEEIRQDLSRLKAVQEAR